MSTDHFPKYLSESHHLPNLKASALDQSTHKSVADLYQHVLDAEAVAWQSVNTETAPVEALGNLTEPTLINIRLVGWVLIALHQRRRSLGDIPMHHVAEDVWCALHKDGTMGIQRRGGQYRRLIRQTLTCALF